MRKAYGVLDRSLGSHGKALEIESVRLNLHNGKGRTNMYKAMYERVIGKPYELDEKDKGLLAERIEARAKVEGPAVGDWLITPAGLLRFTHDWGDSIQTTVRPGYDASFYVTQCGHMSFSGSLASAIDKSLIEATEEMRDGACWFFSHEYAEASNGVRVEVPCKVYRLREA